MNEGQEEFDRDMEKMAHEDMPRLLILRGLQASGKTTFAKQWVAQAPGIRSRVNRDDIRDMMHDGFYAPSEAAITKAEHAMISALLAAGRSVVVDNLNLRKRYVRSYMELAHEAGVPTEFKDFEVDPETAILGDDLRDRGGGRSVGPDVIRETAKRFHIGGDGKLPEKPELDEEVQTQVYVPDPTNIQIILVDIDGTVALHNGRSPYDYSRVLEDLPNTNVIRVVQELRKYFGVIFLSGRPETCREDTATWLERHVGHFDGLFMRPADKLQVNDAVIKVELFNQHIRDRYNVIAVFDDRNRVVRAWRKLGLTCLQVNDGAF